MLKYFNKHFSVLKVSYEEIIPIVFFTIIIGLLIKIPLIEIYYFIVCSILLIIGKTMFTIGAKAGLEPLGKGIGLSLIKNRKISIIIIIVFLIGFLLTIFESDLKLYSMNIPNIPNYIIIIAIGIGIGFYLVIAYLKCISKINTKIILTISYIIILILSVSLPEKYIGISFDSIVITTGPLFVPFVTTLGLGLMSYRMDKHYKKDGFGALALCSAGHLIIMLLIMQFVSSNNIFDFNSLINEIYKLRLNIETISISFKEVIYTSVPFIIVLIIYLIRGKNLNQNRRIKLIIAIIMSIIGLGLIAIALNTGFSNIGYLIGTKSREYWYILIPICMIYGFLIVKAEPAVNLLNEQIETITIGSINKRKLMFNISLAVSFASLVAMLKIILHIPLLWILLIGYLIVLILSYLISETFTLIAFDSATAATGPITIALLLPIIIGFCGSNSEKILIDGFGLIALINLFPIITIEIYGLIYKYKSRILKTYNDYDDKIIEYNWRNND